MIMKKLAVLLFAVLAMTAATIMGATSASAKVAPDESLVGVNTENATIYGLAGEKPLFLNFWATWCPPCVGEMPGMEAMYKKYGDRLHFAAVSVDEEPGAAAAFVQKTGLTLPVYTGDLSRIANDYSIDAIPRSILIGTDGSVLAEHLGAMSEKDLEEFLSKAL